MKWRTPNATLSLSLLTAATLACLLPFIGKPFNIDDPLFVWTAKQIQAHPLDFYGFKVNWGGTETPMSNEMQNPPLAAYYMAPVGALFHWNEAALHAWFLLPALALVWGMWFLARNFCGHPLATALLAVTAPVFLISATSVMCDILMLAFWVWAVILWMGGLRAHCPARLCGAALLISASELTKYFGMSLIPLLLVYSVAEKRRAGVWLIWFVIPVLVMAGYQWLTFHLYGLLSLFNAANFASTTRVGGDLHLKIITVLSFIGGCMVILAALAPWLWSRKALVWGIGAILLTGLILVAGKSWKGISVDAHGGVNWPYVSQFACAIVAGASLAALAAADWLGRKTPDSLLLLLWVAGTAYFACFLNWTVSARNILPMLPAVCLLLIRRLERRRAQTGRELTNFLWAPLSFSLGVGLLAAWTDYRLATSARQAADAVIAKSQMTPDHAWFEGHWGFQYYMQQRGARAIDWNNILMLVGDVVVAPLGNNGSTPLPKEDFAPYFSYDGQTVRWFSIMSRGAGAGYYSDAWGPMPFALGPSPADRYLGYCVK